MRSIIAACVLLAGVGCKGKDKPAVPAPDPAGGPSATPATPTPTPKPTAGPTKPATPGPAAATPDSVRAEALATLTAWTAAQNQGDQAAYFAAYEPRHFKGVKRTSKGAVKAFDFAGWKADRTRMFGKQPTVAVEGAEVQTWLDDGVALKPGVSIVRFTQRWKADAYADHGIKVLHMWRDPQAGQRIIYEDLLNAETGWDDAPAAGVAELDVKPPADDDAALALWKQLAPTGADYQDKLASLPDDPAVTRPLARVLLAGGELACDKKVEYDQCGEEYSEWEPLDDKADFADPCLRRRLAVWALEDAGLTEADARALADDLGAVFKLPRPEDELQPAVLALVANMSDATRLTYLAAAVAGDRADLAEEALGGLSDASLVAVYRAHSLDNAVKALDVTAHRAVLLEALVDDDLTVATRSELLDSFDDIEGVEVNAALAKVAGDDHCELAMDAALALAARGDPSHLPEKPKNADVGAHGRALCMLLHDPDEARQLARWQAFLPPGKGATVTEEIEDDFAERPDGDAGVEDDAGVEEPERVTRADDLEELDDTFGADETPSCSANTCEVQTSSGHFDVSFEKAEDGTLYISNLHTFQWSGCGC